MVGLATPDKTQRVVVVPQHFDSIDFDHATIVDRARNFHERLFLEAWYSQRDSNAGNENIDIPDVYKSLA